MPRLTFILGDGSRTALDAEAGTSVMLAARQNGVPGIIGECGGFCNCGTCHVYVDVPWLTRLPVSTSFEDDMLDCVAATRRPNSRLGCQIVLNQDLDGLSVEMPDAQV